MIVQKLSSSYFKALKTHPYKTNILTSCLLMFIGDVSCQLYETVSSPDSKTEDVKKKTGIESTSQPTAITPPTSLVKVTLKRDKETPTPESASRMFTKHNESQNQHYICYPGGLIMVNDEDELCNDPMSEDLPVVQRFYSWNPARTLIMCSWTALASSPAFVTWFRYADVFVPGSGIGQILSKSFLTVFAIAGPLNAGFFAYVTTIETLIDRKFIKKLHKNDINTNESITDEDSIFESAKKKVHDRLGPTTLAAAKLWIPVNIINFLFIAGPNRVLFSSVVALCWSGYLSFVQHSRSI